jgi:hypothetical protein
VLAPSGLGRSRELGRSGVASKVGNADTAGELHDGGAMLSGPDESRSVATPVAETVPIRRQAWKPRAAVATTPSQAGCRRDTVR